MAAALIEGYESDVTRTGVFGKASAKVQQVFEIVRKAQDAALDAARAGKLSGSVDDAARAVVRAAMGPTTNSLRTGSAMAWDSTATSILIWYVAARRC